MNIFVVSEDPVSCAKFLDNKRLVKMVLETAQLLCTAINYHGGTSPYKSTHVNHPCSIWVRASKSNYEWLFKYFIALSDEYTLRYNRIHKCQDYCLQLALGVHYIPEGDFTLQPNCTTFKEEKNLHLAYKLYLEDKWKNDKRKPDWSHK